MPPENKVASDVRRVYCSYSTLHSPEVLKAWLNKSKRAKYIYTHFITPHI
jgi:hypothetical protein